MKFVRHVSPAHFLTTAEPWLLRAEAEHGLLLGLARSRVDSQADPAPSELFATVQDGDRVVGCLFRVPPQPLGLTTIPEAVLPLSVHQVASIYPTLPGVFGPPATVRAFAEAWAGRFGVAVRTALEMEIHVLTRLTPPPHPAPGRMRRARAGEAPLLEEWGRRFVEDTGINATDSASPSRALMARDSLYVWEDEGTVRSMAGALGPTPGGIRIGYVYTPPSERGRGYASALVSELTRLLLDGGRDFCFLYTDRANPTSNGIYRRLGYRPVALSTALEFEAPSGG